MGINHRAADPYYVNAYLTIKNVFGIDLLCEDPSTSEFHFIKSPVVKSIEAQLARKKGEETHTPILRHLLHLILQVNLLLQKNLGYFP
jgi:hypothetical protein